MGILLIQILFALLVNRFLFHPVVGRYTLATPGVVDISTNETTIAALVLGNLPNDRVLLYCHGNAEDIMDVRERFPLLREKGFSIVSVDYPGYGCSKGSPSESGCYRNVNRLYDWLVHEKAVSPTNIIVMGFSIGTGPAIELATKREVRALVLAAPFLSAPRCVTQIRLFLCDPFQNEKKARSLNLPCVVVHGTDDEIVPFSQGKRIFELIPSSDKRFIAVSGSGHNDLLDVFNDDEYAQVLLSLSLCPVL